MQRKVGNYIVETTNEDKILFPKSKITKKEFLDYYERIAAIMLPYVMNRPLSMQRFPQGIKGKGFYQKNTPDYFPQWVARFTVEKQEDGTVSYVLANNAATLVYLAQQDCIAMHPWLSLKDKSHIPDHMIFDLDPPKKNDFKRVVAAALALKEIVESLGLVPFVKTTGSKGLHIMIPIKREYDFDEVKSYASSIADVLVAKEPQYYTREVRKDKRRGRVFIDVLRNTYGHTAVAPYSVRAYEGAPIAAPLEWDELKNAKLTSQKYTIKNIFRRLSKLQDPWQGAFKHARSLRALKKKLLIYAKNQDS